MRILLVICDGMADRPAKALNGLTPLEAAEVPNMDKLAREGQTIHYDCYSDQGRDKDNTKLLVKNPLESAWLTVALGVALTVLLYYGVRYAMLGG